MKSGAWHSMAVPEPRGFRRHLNELRTRECTQHALLSSGFRQRSFPPSCTRKPTSAGIASPSDSALPRDVDWQVLDARLLNRLWVELHQCQYFLRHTHFDGEPKRAGFSCSKRVVMRPMSTRKLIREGFRSR